MLYQRKNVFIGLVHYVSNITSMCIFQHAGKFGFQTWFIMCLILPPCAFSSTLANLVFKSQQILNILQLFILAELFLQTRHLCL